MIYCEVILLTSLVSILGEPGWSLSVSFNDPLALILFRRCLSRVQHHSLYGGSLKRAPFLFPYLSSDFCSLLAHLFIAVGTKDMFLLQVTTFRTNVYIVLNFNKLLWVSSPTPVNFNGASTFGSCHPKDTIQKAGILFTSTGIICWLCKYGWALYC